MNLSLLLEMAGSAFPDRTAVVSDPITLSYGDVARQTSSIAAWLEDQQVPRVVYLDTNTSLLPLLLHAAFRAGVPFAPLNYRLDAQRINELLQRLTPAVVVAGPDMTLPEIPDGIVVHRRDDVRTRSSSGPQRQNKTTETAVDTSAIELFTSGTTGPPKLIGLPHRQLASYVLETTELGSGVGEATLVSVPPYHIAAMSAILSNTYAGRTIVYMESFDPEQWVELVNAHQVTHTMVVPTMLARILDVVESRDLRLASLRHLAYGGGRMPGPVLRRALELLPHTDFVNAYGLTETSSTIALLSGDDHREAMASDDPLVRARLGSVGRPIPGVEIEIRKPDGRPAAAGEVGEICVRGRQVVHGAGDGDSDAEWFATRDAGYQDEEGYLYVLGRMDDIIVRGGENVSPGFIEDVARTHPGVEDVAVFGALDEEWGERIAMAVVASGGLTANELAVWLRSRLRSAYRPDDIHLVDELPYTETGKVLRRELRTRFGDRHGVEDHR